MARGIYLTLGLNAVDPARYDNWDGRLNACENDARDMAAIAQQAGFSGTVLLTADATSTRLLEELHDAAGKLASGDMLVLGYSGHGGQVGDVTADEEDGLDETWCLYDRMVVDDELYAMWSHFRPGVRILVLSDSCHSGTMAKLALYQAGGPAAALAGIATGDKAAAAGVKAIPFKQSWDLYLKDKPMYDALQYVAGKEAQSTVAASVILISGCQDNQLSLDGEKNSMFTGMLKRVWDSGKYSRNYKEFRGDIVKLMPPSQTPSYYLVGAPDLAFEAQVPFTL